jgi:ELMO domain-containing protein
VLESDSKYSDVDEELSMDQPNVDELYDTLCELEPHLREHTDRQRIGANVRRCLQQLIEMNLLIEDMTRFKNENFDEKNNSHVELLERVWQGLKPDISRTRPGAWKELGFQGMHPKTDFRGMGMLGLHNLAAFSQRFSDDARDVLLKSNAAVWYPFAIAGINFTNDIYHAVSSREWDQYFFTYGISMRTLHALYAEYSVRFGQYWVSEKPATVMEFEQVHRKFVSVFSQDMRNGKVKPFHFDD